MNSASNHLAAEVQCPDQILGVSAVKLAEKAEAEAAQTPGNREMLDHMDSPSRLAPAL